ncbi:MAG TPA: adenylate/guanylate cyclase domain-containing protein [Actinomycetota bacterium]|nr:adenylate/guanylate cyclase domain-containing protein [Actinomycetota bacterium]
MDPRLASIAEQIESTGWAASLCDAQWRLVWVSSEMTVLLGESDPDKLGIGKHMVECHCSPTWRNAVTEESQYGAFAQHVGLMVPGTPGGKEAIVAMLESGFRDALELGEEGSPEAHETLLSLLDGTEAVEPPLVWTYDFDFLQGDLPPARVSEIAVRAYDGGELLGTVFLFGPALPASVLSLVARGDADMYARMKSLVRPGRRQAAILFTDLQASGPLARRLPSAAYFRLVCAITTAIDEVVIRHRGIVGKHAGDGVTAFFLADDLGSSSRAARAAIEAARDVAVAARDAAKEVAQDTGLIDPAECFVNVGAHWGGALYMGQLVTGGRLEVTALGDRVNEAARIQQSAGDGQILASKSLVEHLSEDDAEAAGIDVDGVVYVPVAELPGAGPKAIRDAGSIPVTTL